jgi:carbonic anhydrase
LRRHSRVAESASDRAGDQFCRTLDAHCGTGAPEVLRDLAGKSSEQQHKACEMASILHSLDNLLTYPWLKRRAEEGKLLLHGWYFDIDTGALLAYSPRQQEFLPLVCPLDPPADGPHRKTNF